MADKGIIFSAPMVRALLDGRKTQTRRLIKPQPDWLPEVRETRHTSGGLELHWPIGGLGQQCGMPIQVPYTPGDRLYVREAFSIRGIYTDVVEVGYKAHERASHTEFVEQWSVDTAKDAKGRGPKVTWPAYKPSIHMPRWASRLWLSVTDVRMQRVQDISEADATAEGLERCSAGLIPAYLGAPDLAPRIYPDLAFRDLWNSLHTKPGETWEDNPWVVAVSFTVAHGNIDRSPE